MAKGLGAAPENMLPPAPAPAITMALPPCSLAPPHHPAASSSSTNHVFLPSTAEWAHFISLAAVITLLPVLLVLAGLLRRIICLRAARRVAPHGGSTARRGSGVIAPAVATAAEHRLEAKQIAASKLRWAVSISLQLAGSMLFSVGLVERMLSRWSTTPDYLYSIDDTLSMLSDGVLAIGFCLMLLGLLPTDRVPTFVVSAVLCALWLTLGSINWPAALKFGDVTWGSEESDSKSDFEYGVGIYKAYELVVYTVAALALPLLHARDRYLRLASPRRNLRHLWRVSRALLLGSSFGFVFIGVLGTRVGSGTGNRYHPRDHLVVAAMHLACAAVFTPRMRAAVHTWLGRLVSRGNAQHAAVVAGLVSGSAPNVALSLARQRFRVLPLERLALDDLLDGRQRGQAQQLFSRSVPAELGACDAFVSHSWSDDARAKFAALQHYDARFRRQSGGRSPDVWIDKACLDQTDIVGNLKCLPINLAGSATLLVVPGPSYPGRLWCIMEFFVYLDMGGKLDNIQVSPLVPTADAAAAAADGASSSLRSLQRELARFDAAKASCFMAQDRDHLLAVIETGWGSLTPFNHLVRKAFAECLATPDPNNTAAATDDSDEQADAKA